VASTRSVLEQIDSHVAESMGLRDGSAVRPALSPVPAARDIGRRPMKGFGRIAVEQVVSDPAQPRTQFDEEAVNRLAESLRAKGQLHPIHVRWSEETQKWVIISGERRWRACRQAGLATVDCFFHEQPLTKEQVLELQLIENLLREDLKPIEEARAFQSLLDLHGWTGKQLAAALQLPASKISRSLALLDLPGEIQEQVERGSVPARTAYELSKVADDGRRRKLAHEAATGTLTTAQAAHVVRRKKRKLSASRPATKQTFYAENGWTVTVTSRVPGTYHHLEQALVEALDEVRLRINNNVRL
jgi:ParB family transcriptional regulator, chromosome partitioning protein